MKLPFCAGDVAGSQHKSPGQEKSRCGPQVLNGSTAFGALSDDCRKKMNKKIHAAFYLAKKCLISP